MQIFPLQAQDATELKSYLGEITQWRDISANRSGETQVYVLELAKGVARADLEDKGIEIIRLLSVDRAIVRTRAETLQHHRSFFTSAHPANMKWKLAMPLLSTDRFSKRHFVLRVSDARAALEKLSAVPVRSRILSSTAIVVYASLDAIIDHVIALTEVSYVGMESFDAHTESRVLDLYLSPNTVNALHHNFPGTNGEGLVLSIKELSYDVNDIDLQGRHVSSPLAAEESDDHATEMATIAAGAGNSFINGRGVAYAAGLSSSDFVDLFPDDDQYFSQGNISVQNHSYGTAIESSYGTLAEAYDHATARMPEVLHVFSSGNRGSGTPDHGAYAGIAGVANLTGNFKMSKNTLAVGSVDTVGRQIAFSSRGPAFDGRIKPELVAYSMYGSSNAAALVSGTVLLLQDAFKERVGTMPKAAMIKALLINSARDAGPSGIDFITGYGNVDAYRAVRNVQAGNFFSGTVSHGQIKTFSVEIPAGALGLKVTLAWNDPPAPAGSAAALINDLDLKIANGTVWLPWVLDSSPDQEALLQPAARKSDRINNVEQVTIEDPVAGTYSVTVEGFDVPDGPQEFHIAYQWDIKGQVDWTFPTASDNVPYDGETDTYFFWKSTLDENSGRLEYTADGGATWNVIADPVDLTLGHYRWTEVPLVTALARARLVTATSVFETDQFTISRPLLASVGFNCSDSVMIHWPMVPGAGAYKVYSMTDEPYAEVLKVTADTAMIIHKDGPDRRLYAVQPVISGVEGLRGPMFDYEDQGTRCYLVSFLGRVAHGEGIYLSVNLGTTYGVSRIDFEKEDEDGFLFLGSADPASTSIEYLDDAPAQGLNRYRARIRLDNGGEVISEIVEDYYLTTLPFVVFPNPVSPASEISVFSKIFSDPNTTFRMFATDGSLVLDAALSSDRESIPLTNISPGFYIYTISSEEGVFNGRIVVK